MYGIGSRTFYAMYNDILFNFEYKRDRDYFVDNMDGAKRVSALVAYKSKKLLDAIKVEASCKLGANVERKREINSWYENKRCCL